MNKKVDEELVEENCPIHFILSYKAAIKNIHKKQKLNEILNKYFLSKNI
jgi:hypothetical protein